MSAAATPASSSVSTPARIARDGSSGVDGTLAIDDLAGVLVEIDEIGERAAGIDRDAETGHAITGVQPERSVPI